MPKGSYLEKQGASSNRRAPAQQNKARFQKHTARETATTDRTRTATAALLHNKTGRDAKTNYGAAAARVWAAARQLAKRMAASSSRSTEAIEHAPSLPTTSRPA